MVLLFVVMWFILLGYVMIIGFGICILLRGIIEKVKFCLKSLKYLNNVK